MRSAYRQRATVLILVLWAIAVLSLVAGGLAFATRQGIALSNIDRDRIISHWLARAGVERAIAAVMDDPRSVDTNDDLWSDDPDEMEQAELTGGTFSVIHDDYQAIPAPLYGAGDECAKLNVNVAGQKQLMKLPNMTAPIAAAIIDWRDKNEEPEPDGIERGYYQGLEHPYTIRNGPVRTVRELLLVRGVTPELLYGEDSNLNCLLDPNENDGDVSEPSDNADGRLDRGWFAYLTVYSYEKNVTGDGEKRLNLNEASAETLSSRLNLEQWAAKSIVKARDKKKDKKFEHLVDLLDVTRDTSDSKGNTKEADINVRSEEDKDRPVTKDIFTGIVDELTLKKDNVLWGKININTAPAVVLATLPGIDEDHAETLVNHRESMGGYTSIADLLDVTGITKKKFAQLEDAITIRSNVFRIHSCGYASSALAMATIECIVDRSEQIPRILYWLESLP